MHKSILVLEESAMVHDLFESALPREYWDWRIEHESFPKNYVSKAEDMLPGIIFLSNQDQKNDYVTVKELRTSAQLKNIPILLLTIAKDKLDEKRLRSLGIQGFLRKPFESATLLEQIEATLQNQKLQQDPRDELENVDVVDEELMGLLSGGPSSRITIDNLEGELDPTLQLHPIEAESMLRDEEDEQVDAIEEMTNLIEEDEENGEVPFEEATDLIEDDLPEEPEISIDNDGNELDEFRQDRAETKAIELELEEIGMDIDEYSHDLIRPTSAETSPAGIHGVMKIAIVIDNHDRPAKSLKNESKTGEIGLMEIGVIPFETENTITSESESQFQTVQVDRNLESPVSGENEFITELEIIHGGPDRPIRPRNGSIVENTAGSTTPYTELAVSHYQADDVIEIEHTEIGDEINDDFNTLLDEEFDNSTLLEISVEGIDTEEAPEEMFADDIDDFEIDSDLLIESTDFGEDEEPLVEELDEGSLLVDELEEPDVEMDIMAEDDPSDIVISNIEDEESERFQDDEDLQEIGGIEDLDQFEQEQGDSEPPFIEQDEMDNLEIDFEEDAVAQPHEIAGDEVDFQLDEIENLDSDSAQMSIQEMINFRQVMKAKYDIPETSATEFDEEEIAEDDLEIGIMSDDEIDDFDLAEPIEDTDQSPAFEEISLEEDMDMTFDEETLEEVDIFAETDDEEITEVDIFADTDEEEGTEIDLFADTDEEEGAEVDLFADTDEEEGEEEDSLLIDDELQDIDSLEATAEDPFLEDDEADFADGVGLPAEDETLTDDTDFEELDEDPFSDLSEIEEDADFLTDAPEMMDEETALDDAPTIDSDEIDLLSDDLQISDDFTETATDSQESKAEALSDSENDTELAADEQPENVPLPEDDEPDILAPPEMDDTDDFFSADDAEDEDVFEEVDLMEESTDDSGSEIPFEPDSMMDQNMSDLEMISETDDVTIEVPQDVFEISDLKMTDIATDLDKDTESDSDEFPVDEPELSEDIDLPSMDEDLPDFPPITEDGEEESDILFEADDLAEPEQGTEPSENSEATQDGIEVLRAEDDFEPFAEESETIEFSDEAADSQEPEPAAASSPDLKKKSPILSADARDKLSGMIENVISDTIQNTLHELLPDMMDKIIQEELDD